MYKPQKRKEARNLFVESGLSYEDVARETGVSLNNLKKWGVKGGWTKQREDYQRSGESLNATISRSMQLIVDKLADAFGGGVTLNSQNIFATVRAGTFLLLLQANEGQGNPTAVLDLLKALNKNDSDVHRVLKRADRANHKINKGVERAKAKTKVNRKWKARKK